MEARIKEAILKQKGALSLFLENERAFYTKYYNNLTDRIIREKRILEFENPNRVKVCYEYDVMALPVTIKGKEEEITFLFLPDKRKSWLKVFLNGKRVTVADRKKVKDVLFEVVKNDVVALKKEMDYAKTEYALWEEIWAEKKPIPCFVFSNDVDALLSGACIIEIAFYDFLDVDTSKKRCPARLFDEKYYQYDYPKVAVGNSWLYVKAPDKFDINVVYDKRYVEKNAGEDPEINSFTIKGDVAPDEVQFKLKVSVPRTLRLWYSALVILGVAYVLSFISVFFTAILKEIDANNFSLVYAQVGISIIAAIIATRGWLMKEETVLRRVSKWFTWIVIVIVALLIGGYSFFVLQGQRRSNKNTLEELHIELQMIVKI